MLKQTLTTLLLAVCTVFVFTAGPVLAQANDDAEPNSAISDPYGRISPLGTVDGYLKAMREADAVKAALFLDARELPETQGARLATQLKVLLDDGGYFFSTDEISSQPEGNLADEMSADLEEVGALQVGRREVPLILQRVASSDSSYIWLFAKTTVDALPALYQQSHQSLLDQLLPTNLKTTKVLTVPVGHWLTMGIVALLALVVGHLIARLFLVVLDWMAASRIKDTTSLNIRSAALPLGVVVAVSIYREAVIFLGVQVVARGATDWIAVTVLWLAVAVLCLKAVDLVAEFLRAVMHAEERKTSLAALILLRKVIKAIIVAILVVQVLEILGFDVTTAIAALGIGGLALALGAQKTVENLVGSVIVVADRPVEVGDFCKFGDTSGTVEDIGIRSTQIRTQARTIVTVPNGAFASMQIENYSVRDKFLFNTILSLRSDASGAQVRQIVKDIRQELETADNIAQGARVNLVDLTRSSLDIEVFCYILAPDFEAHLCIKETLIFFLLDAVSNTGSVLAFPPTNVQLSLQEIQV